MPYCLQAYLRNKREDVLLPSSSHNCVCLHILSLAGMTWGFWSQFLGFQWVAPAALLKAPPDVKKLVHAECPGSHTCFSPPFMQPKRAWPADAHLRVLSRPGQAHEAQCARGSWHPHRQRMRISQSGLLPRVMLPMPWEGQTRASRPNQLQVNHHPFDSAACCGDEQAPSNLCTIEQVSLQLNNPSFSTAKA